MPSLWLDDEPTAPVLLCFAPYTPTVVPGSRFGTNPWVSAQPYYFCDNIPTHTPPIYAYTLFGLSLEGVPCESGDGREVLGPAGSNRVDCKPRFRSMVCV
jgi:hypothetical protein